jgi:hypothetical protein
MRPSSPPRSRPPRRSPRSSLRGPPTRGGSELVEPRLGDPVGGGIDSSDPVIVPHVDGARGAVPRVPSRKRPLLERDRKRGSRPRRRDGAVQDTAGEHTWKSAEERHERLKRERDARHRERPEVDVGQRVLLRHEEDVLQHLVAGRTRAAGNVAERHTPLLCQQLREVAPFRNRSGALLQPHDPAGPGRTTLLRDIGVSATVGGVLRGRPEFISKLADLTREAPPP